MIIASNEDLFTGPCGHSFLSPGSATEYFHVGGKRSEVTIFRWFKFTLKPPYSITHDKLRLVIWDTSFWTFLVKFEHKGP